jgi:hypothetical protein
MNFSKPTAKTARYSALFGVCSLALAACGPRPADFSILPASQGAFQSSTANNKVDILWVIKNSGTMLIKQQLLGNSFNSFINNFNTYGFDYQMAVITPDLTGGGQGAKFQGNPLILTENTPNLANAFSANAQVGNTGNFRQTFFDASVNALSNPLLTGFNSGFIRSDAQLAVIYVSDSDEDYSSTTTTALYNFFNTLKPPIYDALAKTYKPAFTISGVIADDTRSDFDLSQCSANNVALYENGYKFETLINQTKGSEAQICEANFAAGLTNISNKIVQAITKIPLGRVPDASTITVAFNGTAVQQDANNGWQYDSGSNSILFSGTGIPNANTQITINYVPNDIIR